MTANYTSIDLLAAFCSTLLFAPLLLPIGYLAGWFSNVLQFRELTAPWRLTTALVLGTVLAPTMAYYAAWAGGTAGAAVVFGLALLAALALLSGAFGHPKVPAWLREFQGIGWFPYLFAAGWLLVALFSLVDLQLGDRLYYNVSSYDHSLRTEFTHAISRTGVPPQNPLYHLGGTAPLRYHYFWFILCSFVERLGGALLNGAQPDSVLNARHAMIGSIVWVGWALAAIIPLYLRFFYGHAGQALRRRSVIGVSLLCVTGLDLLPTIFYYYRWHYVYPDMEWWNAQISAWVSALLWVPHHLISFLACLLGFLLLWQAQKASLSRLIPLACLAGVAFTTAAGTSVFVTLVFAAFFVLWLVLCLLRGWRGFLPAFLLAGIVAVVLAAPHLLHIMAKGAGGPLLRFEVRAFMPLDRVLTDHHASLPVRLFMRVLFLPLNYGLELGFFLLGGILYWLRAAKTKTRPQADAAATLLLSVSVLMCTFLSSSLVNNDLGMRGFMPAQFVLLLWSADWLAGWREDPSTAVFPLFSWLKPLAAACLVIGVAGSLYAVLILRFYGVATDNGWSRSEFFPHGNTGAHTFAFRQTYEQLRRMLPPSAIVQTNPAGKYNDFPFGLYALRRTASMNDSCGAEFGGDPAECAAAWDRLDSIFSDVSHPDPRQVEEFCRRYAISALVMRDTDRAWRDRDSWMWKLSPVLANKYVRVYRFDNAKDVTP